MTYVKHLSGLQKSAFKRYDWTSGQDKFANFDPSLAKYPGPDWRNIPRVSNWYHPPNTVILVLKATVDCLQRVKYTNWRENSRAGRLGPDNFRGASQWLIETVAVWLRMDDFPQESGSTETNSANLSGSSRPLIPNKTLLSFDRTNM